MHCNKCGEELDEKSKFCSKCGVNIAVHEDVASEQVARKWGWKNRVAILSVAALVVAVIFWVVRPKPSFEKGMSAVEQKNYVVAFQQWEPLAEDGDERAQFNLGILYSDGLGVEKDLAKSAYWFTRAAENNVPQAQYNIGLMYFKGIGVTKDHNQARYWLKKAINNGNEDARRFGNLPNVYLGN